MLANITPKLPKDANIQLPILTSKNRGGKPLIWFIYVDDHDYIKTYGQVAGKWVSTNKSCSGTNMGKKNERTPFEQAESESLSVWKKQIDKGYKPFEDDVEGTDYYNTIVHAKAQQGGKNHGIGTKDAVERRQLTGSAVTVEVIKPMLAQSYMKRWDEEKESIKKANDNGRKLRKQLFIRWDEPDFYLLGQAKLDGERCVARKVEGEIVLSTRPGKIFPHFNHIKSELLQHLPDDMVLDCEVYTEYLDQFNGSEIERFSWIQGVCSLDSEKPAEDEDKIFLYVFDIIDTEATQTERFSRLKTWFNSHDFKNVKLVEWKPIHSHAEADRFLTDMLALNFEGVMLRDPEAVYFTNHRVNHLLKYKKFDDAEFEVTDVIEVNRGFVVYECWNKERTKKFRAKPEGSIHVAQALLKNKDNLINRSLTVKYQGLSADGIPRFPIGKSIRKN